MTRVNGAAPVRRRHQQPHYFTRPCLWCQGTGERTYNGRTTTCGFCKGTRTLTTRLDPS